MVLHLFSSLDFGTESTYAENIKIIKDDLTIRSESGNPDDTTIKAKSPTAHVFSLQANNVKTKGLKISGASKYGYAGVCLSSCSDCTIENNILLSNSFGVCLLRQEYCLQQLLQ